MFALQQLLACAKDLGHALRSGHVKDMGLLSEYRQFPHAAQMEPIA